MDLISTIWTFFNVRDDLNVSRSSVKYGQLMKRGTREQFVIDIPQLAIIRSVFGQRNVSNTLTEFDL